MQISFQICCLTDLDHVTKILFLNLKRRIKCVYIVKLLSNDYKRYLKPRKPLKSAIATASFLIQVDHHFMIDLDRLE